MAYCTLADLLDAIDEADLIAYTDDDDSGIVDGDVVDWGITGAAGMIDSYLARRHTVPLSPVPDMIRDLAVDIALYKITFRRGSGPDDRRTKYEDAVKFLEKAAAGTITIPDATAAAASAGADTARITSDDRIFTRDKMRGF